MIGDRPPVTANLILPILIKPALKTLEKQYDEAALDIKLALLKAESTCPGLILEMTKKMIKNIDPNFDVTKSLLKLQGNVVEDSNNELNKRAILLKRILSRIPDEINDRKVFLDTIKEVASAIKKLLDCVSDCISCTQDLDRKQALEDRKRDFIRCSKRFSNKLKEFFREGNVDSVYYSAAHLINQTYALQLTA